MQDFTLLQCSEIFALCIPRACRGHIICGPPREEINKLVTNIHLTLTFCPTFYLVDRSKRMSPSYSNRQGKKYQGKKLRQPLIIINPIFDQGTDATLNQVPGRS